ncbi:MAG: hypothetical protein KAR19_07965 [Bacteroidales bacterium]|nr:hypothetical protein [Bacteroidales bacterium]
MFANKKHKTANDFLRYLKGELSKRERHSFERDLEANPFEKEALEGLETITPDQAKEDILSMHSRLRKRLSRRKRIAVYSIAATVASLLIVGTVFLQIYDFNPEGTEKTMYEEDISVASSDEPAESLPVKTLTEEAITMEAQADDETTGGAIIRDHSTRESSVEPVQEEQKATKGPSKAAAVPVPEMPVAEVPVAEMPVAEVQDVQVFQEYTKAEQITFTEAQPMAMEEEVPMEKVLHEAAPETRIRKQAGRRKESLSQSVTERPQEMSKKAISQEEFDELISGEASHMVISAEPSGGFKSFKKYIEENIQFPAEDTTTGRAVIILKFIVTPAGEIKEIMALRSPGQPFTNEAMRLVLEGPLWNPATNEYGNTEEIVRIRIVFKK